MNKIRYWISYQALNFAMWIIPDESVRVVLNAGITAAANILLGEEDEG